MFYKHQSDQTTSNCQKTEKTCTSNSSLWPPYAIGQAIIFLPCGIFFCLLLLFFPRLISAVADWMSTILPHIVWP